MYYLIYLKEGKKVREKITDKDQATTRLAELRSVYGEHQVFVAYGARKEPPKGWKRKGNTLWCPFCHKPRVFENHGKGPCACPVCGVTEKDFYVIRFNKLARATPVDRDSKGRLIYDVQQVKLKRKRGGR